MELKTKYQYSYFIYPYLIKDYTKYIYKLLKNKKCKLKVFDKNKDIQIASYFLPEIKDIMFWSLDVSENSIKSYNTMDLKMKANILSKKQCNFFEYTIDGDVSGKIGEKNGIFFDITKIEIVCFDTGICFLIIKTEIDENSNMSEVLNFNYKFRDICSKIGHTKEFENIKIQTRKFDNMKKFSKFIEEIAGTNIETRKLNIDTEKLITYSYVCLDQNSWNENTDISSLEKEFEKYRNINPANEQITDSLHQERSIYKEKYLYYGFSNNSTVLLTCDNNIKNYTSLLFEYENVQLYHFIYCLHQKNYLKKLNYEFNKTKNFEKIKTRFLEFAKRNWIYEITNNPNGVILDKYFCDEQKLDDAFIKLKTKYDLLYKEYKVEKMNKYHKIIISVIGIITIIALIKLWISLIN